MASLQSRHARDCTLGRPWTTFSDAAGCGCKPTYYIVVREAKKLHREKVGKNRKRATEALTQTQAKEDRGEFVPVREIRFDAFADEWL